MASRPIYLAWDTIEFTVEIEHNFPLGDAWAIFERHSLAGEVNSPIKLHMEAQEIEQTGRIDNTQIVSEVVFRVTVHEGNSVPGDYDLKAIRGLPMGAPRGGEGRDLGLPFSGASFRIAPFHTTPTTRVTKASLERRPQGRIYPRD